MSATEWAPGKLIASRYRIDAPIGEGGFGTVFRATELKLDRQVAVKALRDEVLGRGDAEGRFHREAQLAKQLGHPNTVRLLDFGTAEDGTPFIVYELLKGQALDEYLHSAGPMSDERVARITAQVLKSLMEAHQHGIVHRDIKPSNIFLCEFSGERDFVKVLDFGIAKSEAYKHAPMTRVGMAIGTPSYMAPEQVHGTGVGPATDLYALGLVMAEALAGRVIISGPTPALTAVEQASDKPVPLPPKVLQSPLGPVILRSTQKAVERRYQNAAEMLAELESIKVGASAATMADGSRAQSELAFARTSWTPQVAPHAPTNQGYAPVPPTAPGAPAGHTPGYASGPHPAGTFAPPSAYGGYAPPPPAAMYAPPPARGSSGSGLMVLLLIGGGLMAVFVLIGLAIIVGIASGSDDGAGATSGDTDEETSEETESSGGAIGGAEARTIEARLEELGWEISGRSESSGTGYRMFVLQVSKGTGGGGVVQVYKYEDPRVADAVEDGLRKVENGAYVRDGDTLLFVVLNEFVDGEVRNVSRSVLEDLQRAL